MCVHGSSLGSPAFQRLLYTALRALIDELGVATFNAGGATGRWRGGPRVVEGAGFQEGRPLRCFRDQFSSLRLFCWPAAIHNIQVQPAPGGDDDAVASSSASTSSGSIASSSAASRAGFLQPRRGPLPVVARLVSRGKLSSQASDFGGLEVFGGASIGHTDPFRVVDALRAVHATLPPAAPVAAQAK